MSRMLLSIKPEYVEKILAGSKKYEFRKFRCRVDVDTIIIYSTSPIKQVVAEVEMLEVVEGDVAEVWQKTKNMAGITKAAYSSYYRGREIATAYKLGNVKVYDQPRKLSNYGLNYVPQSFAYLD